MSDTQDLIVVGAGPAGSSCARRAAELGLSTLVLEKSTFPRPKPCAAGLTQKAMSLLGDAVDDVAHRRVHTVEISVGRLFSLSHEGIVPYVTTTTRGELDVALARAASEAGADVEFGTRVDSVVPESASVTVEAGGRRFRARYVVAADGTRGSCRSMLKLSPLRLGGGIYVRAFPPSADGLSPFTDRVVFDLTATSRGYSWSFPKRDHLNVGIFSQHELRPGLARDLESCLASRGLASWRTEGPFAYPIPLGIPRDALGTDRVLFVGDAAGLVDPVLGEGISHSIESGRAAASAVAAAKRIGIDAADAYRRHVLHEIAPSVNRLTSKGNFVYSFPPGLMRAVVRVPPVRAVLFALWRSAAPVGRSDATCAG